jgi:hypothetical protein
MEYEEKEEGKQWSKKRMSKEMGSNLKRLGNEEVLNLLLSSSEEIKLNILDIIFIDREKLHMNNWVFTDISGRLRNKSREKIENNLSVFKMFIMYSLSKPELRLHKQQIRSLRLDVYNTPFFPQF